MATLRAGLILVLAALVAACDSAGPSSAATNIAITPTPAVASASPVASKPPTATQAPSVKPPVTSGATTGPAPTSAPAVSADSCSGSASNKTFFATNSPKVTFGVYCAVLPNGWYLDVGSYAAANGGTFTIGYRNNAGNRFDLKEGAWCQGVPIECGPYDTAIGNAAYGDIAGQLGKKGSAFVLYVRPGQNPAWSATGMGIDEATFRSFAQALVKVAK